MKRSFTAVIKQDEGWWIGWIEEVTGVNSQGRTRRELVKNLRSTLKEALAMIQRAVNVEPGNGYYLDSLGWAYFKLGNIDEAERYLTEAARIVTSSPGIQEHLGDLYQRRNKPDAARAEWQKALLLSPEAEQTSRLRAKLTGGSKK